MKHCQKFSRDVYHNIKSALINDGTSCILIWQMPARQRQLLEYYNHLQLQVRLYYFHILGKCSCYHMRALQHISTLSKDTLYLLTNSFRTRHDTYTYTAVLSFLCVSEAFLDSSSRKTLKGLSNNCIMFVFMFVQRKFKFIA